MEPEALMARMRAVGPAAREAESGPDSAALLASVVRGDSAALAALYSHTSARLFGVALRLLRRRDLAEEALHDAFLKVWQRAESYSPDRGSADAWLATIVRNTALDRLRRQGREMPLEEAAGVEEIEAPESEPMRRLLATADGQALAACLGELEPEPRHCILLAYWQGYSQEELALLLGRPLGTVKSWVRRSLLRLRHCLER
jgi:RNA polymerase sigma-70 factor, ECF subfamily